MGSQRLIGLLKETQDKTASSSAKAAYPSTQ